MAPLVVPLNAKVEFWADVLKQTESATPFVNVIVGNAFTVMAADTSLVVGQTPLVTVQ